MRIKKVAVAGFKSILDEQVFELAPLTVFSGANSGGKSSAIQTLLLMKQTVESQYDPGTILLYGPNAKFTSSDQIFSRGSNIPTRSSFTLGLFGSNDGIKIRYELAESGAVRAKKVEVTGAGAPFSYTEKSRFSYDDLPHNVNPGALPIHVDELRRDPNFSLYWGASPDRCFPDLRLFIEAIEPSRKEGRSVFPLSPHATTSEIRQSFARIIHIRGLRGNPERSYLATAKAKSGFPGVFEDYVASVLLHWQRTNASKISSLSQDLRRLGLTWKVRASPIEQTHAEIRVGRLESATQGGAHDLVSLADVGLGVSQILPFLVALHAARPGYAVFIEQPEIHLHPRAQMNLAGVIADAMRRGVHVWMETHSSVLLRAMQTAVAKGDISASDVRVNWFQRDPVKGTTSISTREPDRFGRLGDWPADFDDVSMQADREYLDAVSKMRAAEHG